MSRTNRRPKGKRINKRVIFAQRAKNALICREEQEELKAAKSVQSVLAWAAEIDRQNRLRGLSC